MKSLIISGYQNEFQYDNSPQMESPERKHSEENSKWETPLWRRELTVRDKSIGGNSPGLEETIIRKGIFLGGKSPG